MKINILMQTISETTTTPVMFMSAEEVQRESAKLNDLYCSYLRQEVLYKIHA